MNRPEITEGNVPVAEREPLYFPDAITELIAERGHEWQREELDGMLDQFPGWHQYAAVYFPVREARARRHDTVLYSMYRLHRLGVERDWWDIRERLERVHLHRTITDAEQDGDHEVAELTRRFAAWAGLEIRDERTKP